MRHRQGRVQERGVKSGQGNYGYGGPFTDRLQDDLPVAAALVLLETQHGDTRLPSLLSPKRFWIRLTVTPLHSCHRQTSSSWRFPFQSS